MSKLSLLAVFALSVGAFSARADIFYNYNFSFSPASGSTIAGSTIEPFSVSFTVNGLLTSEEPFAFSPVTMTDGVHSVSLVAGLGFNGLDVGCFVLHTSANYDIQQPNCDAAALPPDGGILLVPLLEPPILPTAAGIYTATSVGTAYFWYGFPPGNYDITQGPTVLTITAVPEPASVILTASLLTAVALAARKRIARG